MTSFGGLVILQRLFEATGLSRLLQRSCAHLDRRLSHYYKHSTVLHFLIVHLFIGCRNLRDTDYYREDPMVLDTLKLRRMPSVPTLSRMLKEFDDTAIGNLREINRDLVLTRLRDEGLRRVTVDFDGSVLSTRRHAEGTAVGFNKQKKGARSYYPLFCTIAQSGQIFDQLHRSGNVHDSNGAYDFIMRCIVEIRAAMPHAMIEVRMDSAFFSDETVTLLGELGVEYTISVPFERFVELKGKSKAASCGGGHAEPAQKPITLSKGGSQRAGTGRRDSCSSGKKTGSRTKRHCNSICSSRWRREWTTK